MEYVKAPLETANNGFEPIPWKNGYHNLNYSDPNFQTSFANVIQ
jgi:hypothetical protein